MNTYIDIIFILALVVFWTYYFRKWFKRGNNKWMGLGLGVYHLALTGLAYQYIQESGGDVRSYWRVVATPYTTLHDWVYLISFSSKYFMILIYPFARLLGLSFESGTLLFSSLSLFGFLWILEFFQKHEYQFNSKNKFFSVLPFLILFLPSTHFWTGMPSKETFLFFALVMSLKFSLKRNYFVAFVFILMSVLIRPATGILMLGMIWFLILQDQKFSKSQKIVFSMIVAGLSLVGLFLLSAFLEDIPLNAQWLAQYSQSQYEILIVSKPTTLISMEEYNWVYRLFVVGFYPLLWTTESGAWMFFITIENTILLLLSLGLPVFAYYYPKFIPYILFIFLYFFVIAVSANVMGIFLRLKSIVILFLALMGGMGWMILAEKISNVSKD